MTDMIDAPAAKRYLKAMRDSYALFREHGSRSPRKLEPLHGWVQNELRRSLEDGPGWDFVGRSATSGKEATVEGEYYGKKVDVLVRYDGEDLAVISVKFVMSNYHQNAINYFEGQLGETANLRRQNLVYGNLFFITNPVPYFSREGVLKKTEQIRDRDIERYAKLRRDHRHAHAPDEMGLGMLDLDANYRRIVSVSVPETLQLADGSWRILDNELSVPLFFDRMALRIRLRQLSP